jgi:predicted site-specific integrase-resolvase
MFRVTPMTVYRWIEEGKLLTFTQRPFRIPVKEVEALQKILSHS